MKESVVVNAWIAEGRAEGRTEGEIISLFTVLKGRFGGVPEDLASMIRATTDLTKLQQWISVAASANTLDAFRSAAGV